MAGVKIGVDLSSVERLEPDFYRALQSGLNDARYYVDGRAKENIDRASQFYAPLNPRYAARKRALGLNPGVLRATGQLRRSIRTVVYRRGSEVIIGVIAERTVRGFDVVEALDQGTSRMPARPFLSDLEKESDFVARVIAGKLQNF